MDEQELDRFVLQELKAIKQGEDLLVVARRIAQRAHQRARQLLAIHRPEGPKRDLRMALRQACNREALCRMVKSSSDIGWRVAIQDISKDGLGFLSISQRLEHGAIVTIKGIGLPSQ